MPTIVFEASIVGPAMTVEEPDGGRLVDICDDARAPVPFSCRGASCGMCRVEVLEGGERLSPPDRYERGVLESFGDPPTRLGRTKSRSCMYAERLDTPLGAMLTVADDKGLRLLEFTDRRALERELTILRQRLKANVVPGEHQHLEAIRMQLARYFSGEELEFDIPLAPIGSDFQLRTWEILRSIPVAETRSYSWMAERLGTPNARRAVGRANGTNMLSIIIPCHRVIRADGTLCGYGGGLWRKKWLLDHEKKFQK